MMVVHGTKARMEALARAINLQLGYPRRGVHVGGGIHGDISAEPGGPGWTMAHAVPVQADDGQWELPAEVPPAAQQAMEAAGALPRRERRPRAVEKPPLNQT